MPGRDRSARQSLGASLTNSIHKSRVLLVGAGGIGCEVLKNLVCCGFGKATGISHDESTREPGITIVDLDTIDLSNLNRQFLFRKQHIKKPKAFVAKETASEYNPAVHIEAHHASIFDARYNVEFFKSFDIVFNALDNLAARRQVNRMCLAAGVPLIESGTTGYNGQVQAIQKGVTQCYDCTEKPVQVSYPICTIRSTPSQLIHCIVWAKSYLLPELFGEASEEDTDMQVTEDDAEEEVAKLKAEAQALKRIRDTAGEPGFGKAVFDKVFNEDVERLRSMEDMWKSRTKPEALNMDDFAQNMDETIQQGAQYSAQDQSTWTLEQNVAVFFASLDKLSGRTSSGDAFIEFDKDDKDTLDFVASAANLRAHIFSISGESEWKIKQMAGNIIPAIATSNAMTASLCVMQAFKIMRAIAQKEGLLNGVKHAKKATGPLGGSKFTFLASRNTERVINTEDLKLPDPHCPVCSPVYAQLEVPEESPTLSGLVDLLKTTFGYDELSIVTNTGLVYDADFDDHLDKTLHEIGIEPGSNEFIAITDEDFDDPKVDLLLSVRSRDSFAISPSDMELPAKPKKPAEESNGHVDVLAGAETNGLSGVKRKREDEGMDTVNKKAKTIDVSGGNLMEDDGTILLDD